MTVPCTFCEREIDPESRMTYRKVIGWERPREGGGTNALTLREPTQVFACSSCIEKLKLGIPIGQPTLI